MTYYRLYFFDGNDRRITGFDEFEAATDVGALTAAENRRRGALVRRRPAPPSLTSLTHSLRANKPPLYALGLDPAPKASSEAIGRRGRNGEQPVRRSRSSQRCGGSARSCGGR